MTGGVVQFMHEIERALRVRRAFHVDADEISRIHGRRFRHEAGNQIAGKFLVDVEPHVGKLQADICVEPPARYFVQQLVIELGAGAGFIGVGDVLAEVIDGDAQAGLVDLLCDAERIFHPSTGHEAAGKTLADGGSFGHPAQPAALGKRDKKRPQHGPPRAKSG